MFANLFSDIIAEGKNILYICFMMYMGVGICTLFFIILSALVHHGRIVF